MRVVARRCRRSLWATSSVAAEQSGADLSTSSADDENDTRTAVEGGQLDAAIVDGAVILSDGQLDPQFEALLQSAHQAVASQQQLVAAGLDPREVQQALHVTPLEAVSVTGDTRYAGSRRAVAFLTVIALFFLIIGSTMQVAMGVVEEKGSRIVEILLVAVRPWQLLAGKIAVFALLGMVQLTVFAVVGIGTAAAVESLPDLPPGTPGIIAAAFVAFLLGFVFYAAVAAALGSLVSRQEEVGQVVGPMTLVITASYLVGIFAVGSPDSTVNEVLSMVPPFAAMVMPVRMAATDVGLGQIGLAIIGMLAAAVAVLVIGGRIYERAVLRTGARVKLTEVWRA